MKMTTIAAVAPSALVTDNSGAFSLALWIGVGLIVVAFVLIVSQTSTPQGDSYTFVDISVLGYLVIGIGVIFVVIGVSGAAGGGLALNAGRVKEVINERYRITSVETVTSTPTEEGLCEPVSAHSPEYAGIADGQQIRFRVGSTNCTSEHPDVTIIVTHTPRTALSADDLRKDNPIEEP